MQGTDETAPTISISVWGAWQQKEVPEEESLYYEMTWKERNVGGNMGI